MAVLSDAVIHLDLPAETAIGRVVRTVGAAMFAQMDASVRDIDRLGLALDEVVAALVEVATGRMEVTIDARGDQVVCAGRCAAASAPTLDPASERIVVATGSSISTAFDGGCAAIEVTVPRT